jgi:hypothetical protein
MLTEKGRKTFEMPEDSPPWTMIDQTAQKNLMAAATADRKHLIGYTWDKMPETLMSNGKYPCMHTGPGKVSNLKNGSKHTWRGRVFFLPDDHQELLNRYDKFHSNLK